MARPAKLRLVALFCLVSLLSLSLSSACAPRATSPSSLDVAAAARAAASRPDWTTADSEQVAKALANRCLRTPGLSQLAKTLGRLPRLRFHPVRDATGEQVDVVAFKRLVESTLLGSGKVELLAPTDERHTARIARREGDRPPTVGREQRADAVLLLLLTKSEGGDPNATGPVVYQATLSLTAVANSTPLCRAVETRRKLPKAP